MLEHTNAGDRWIPKDKYKLVCSLVPILCVDLLPILPESNTFGLIERDDYKGRRGFNLVGGAVLIDEPLEEAVMRHLTVTLGGKVQLDASTLNLVGVYQYIRESDSTRPHDPRKNAVSVTYAGRISGSPEAAGEAYAFHSFEIDNPPPLDAFGFGQGHVVYDALKATTARPTSK